MTDLQNWNVCIEVDLPEEFLGGLGGGSISGKLAFGPAVIHRMAHDSEFESAVINGLMEGIRDALKTGKTELEKTGWASEWPTEFFGIPFPFAKALTVGKRR